MAKCLSGEARRPLVPGILHLGAPRSLVPRFRAGMSPPEQALTTPIAASDVTVADHLRASSTIEFKTKHLLYLFLLSSAYFSFPFTTYIFSSSRLFGCPFSSSTTSAGQLFAESSLRDISGLESLKLPLLLVSIAVFGDGLFSFNSYSLSTHTYILCKHADFDFGTALGNCPRQGWCSP